MPNGKDSQKLANAPLVYVLAQVRFSSILSMEKYIPDIQEKLRKDYPKYRKITLQSLSVGANGAAPELKQIYRWEFANKTADTGFIIQSDSFVFHTTAYTKYADFIRQVGFVLEGVNSTIDISLVERLGLRYVDLINPEEGEDIDSYIVPSVSGFPVGADNAELIISHTETIAKTDQGMLVLKATKKKNDQVLPPDFTSIGLDLKKTATSDALSAILDSDHYIEQPMEFSLAEILEKFQSLHDAISVAFWATVTKHAIGKWS